MYYPIDILRTVYITISMPINLNIPNGADIQYHTGVLCGLCEASFTQQFEICLCCPDYWSVAMFVSIIIAVIAEAGLVLVALMFALI